jgi:hypothetical protein
VLFVWNEFGSVLNTYALFGLQLSSSVEFPELPRGTGPADVTLSLERLERPSPGNESQGNWVTADSEGHWLVWEGYVSVHIGGDRIRVDPAEGMDPVGLRSVLLGPVFSAFLSMRGLLPLHASCVGIDGRAVAMAANAEAGKSTLAATLTARGHTFLADDVTCVNVAGDPICMLPAFPQLKLLPDSLAVLGESAEALPLVSPLDEKRARRVDGPFGQAGVPIRGIYLIEDGPDGFEGPLEVPEALLNLLGLCHRLSILQEVSGLSALMERCAALAQKVPVYRLFRQRSIARLGHLAQRLEEHVAR